MDVADHARTYRDYGSFNRNTLFNYLNANVNNDIPHWTLTYCFPLTM